MKTRDLDFVFDGVGLKAITKSVDGKDAMYIAGVASSTAKDLYGDIITPKGQQSMLAKLRGVPVKDQSSRGLTAWLNHSYEIPEDTLGVIESASLNQRAGDAGDLVELEIEVRVTEENPRAIAAWKQVQDGIRHGWSIGAYFLDVDWANPDDPDDWGFQVNDVDLLEISLVGIPANQESWSKGVAQAKERAVRAAERIAKSALPAERRELVRKSLIHQLDDDNQMSTDEMRARCMMAQDCINKAMGHGSCGDGMDHMKAAASHLAYVIEPAGQSATYAAPVATTDTTSPITLSIEIDTKAATAALEALQAKAAEAQDVVDALNATIVAKTAEIAAAEEKLKLLDAAIAEREARRLGRITQTNSEAAPNARDAAHDPEAYNRPITEQYRRLGQEMSGVPTDARSSAAAR